MGDTTRIDELRRRVERDPASIAFAQLAEEYRRTGQYEEAVRVSRAGLAQHPAYLSARVTLGRALTDLQRFDEAQAELEYVLGAAPDNQPAIRALADLHQHRGEQKVSAHAADPIQLPREPDDAVFETALASLDALTLDVPSLEAVDTSDPAAPAPPRDPVLAELEAWLDAILIDRERRILNE